MSLENYTHDEWHEIFNRTSFSGDLVAAFDELVYEFGQPNSGDGSKTTAEWRLVIDGHPVMIYDYRGSRWHVGGKRGDADVAAVVNLLVGRHT